MRLPRSLMAGLVGAGLAIVGTALPAVTPDPLADPHLPGISSGGAFGSVLALLHTGMFLGTLTVPMMAFAGTGLTTLFVLGLARLAVAGSASRLVLVGVAVSFVIMSLANVLIFFGDPRATHAVVFWMLGGLGLTQATHLARPLAILILRGFYFWLNSAKLNGVLAADETASTLGISAMRFRLAVFVAGALLTGVVVAYSGLIGFVGLMMPAAHRQGDLRRQQPAGIAGGGAGGRGVSSMGRHCRARGLGS